MQIITGYTGESHVISADDASLYRGIFGSGDYVLDVGSRFAATIIDNNTIRIADGDLVIQGHQARIRANDYEEVTIDNGTPGLKRNDLIVARYKKNTTTGIESITLEVIKGTPGQTAVDPDVVREDLTTGGTQRDFPLYRVSLNGLVLESITSLFTVLPTLNNYKSHLADISTNGEANKIAKRDSYGQLFVGRRRLMDKGQVLSLIERVYSGFVIGATAESETSLGHGAFVAETWLVFTRCETGANTHTIGIYLVSRQGTEIKIAPILDDSSNINLEVLPDYRLKISAVNQNNSRTVVATIVGIG